MKPLKSKYPEDERILEELRQNIRKTQEKIYDDYRDYFLGFLIKKSGCTKEESKEVYKESFAILCNNIVEKRLEPPLRSALRTYLCGIGWRLLLTRYPQYRSEKNRPKSTLEFISIENSEWEKIEYSSYINNYEEQLAKTTLIRELMERLDQRCKKIIELRFWDDASHRDIQLKMGISKEGTARKGFFDCIKKLRKLLRKRNDLDQYL